MPIEYSPLLETDMPQVSEVQWEALVSNHLYQIMFPEGGTLALLDYTSVQARKHFHYPCVHFFKATDKNCSPSTIVAFAKWIVYNKKRDSPEEGQWRPEEQRDPTPAEDVDIEVAKEWTPKIREMRRITMGGKPHCLLDTLHVLPGYQGRGIGASLVRFGTDIADTEGLPCYLESSPAGKSLYARCGFEEVGEMSIDLNKYRKGSGIYKHAVMIRPARQKS